MKSVLFGFLALLMVAGATTPRNRQDAGRYALASPSGEIRRLLSRRLSAMPKGLKRNWQRISVFPHRGRGRCGVKVEPSSRQLSEADSRRVSWYGMRGEDLPEPGEHFQALRRSLRVIQDTIELRQCRRIWE